MLDPELIQYFDELEHTIGTPGWRRIVDDAKKQVYQFQCAALEEARSFEQVCYMRGQAEQLAYLINLPETLKTLRAQHEALDSEEA